MTSRPDLGERWPSRLVATAEEDRLNIRHQSTHVVCSDHALSGQPGRTDVGPGWLQLADIPRMTPKSAWRVAILQRPWKPDARCGWLPRARAARTMVEGLIWLFSLASGRIPPVDCA